MLNKNKMGKQICKCNVIYYMEEGEKIEMLKILPMTVGAPIVCRCKMAYTLGVGGFGEGIEFFCSIYIYILNKIK